MNEINTPTIMGEHQIFSPIIYIDFVDNIVLLSYLLY